MELHRVMLELLYLGLRMDIQVLLLTWEQLLLVSICQPGVTGT